MEMFYFHGNSILLKSKEQWQNVWTCQGLNLQPIRHETDALEGITTLGIDEKCVNTLQNQIRFIVLKFGKAELYLIDSSQDEWLEATYIPLVFFVIFFIF